MNEGKILRLQNSYYMKLQSVRQAHQDRLALEKLQLVRQSWPESDSGHQSVSALIACDMISNDRDLCCWI